MTSIEAMGRVRSASVGVARVPGLVMGFSVIGIGAAMIPHDPFIEGLWDRAHSFSWAETVAVVMTKSGNWLCNVVIIALILILCKTEARRKAAVAAVAGLAGALVCEAIKYTVGRGRPGAVGEINHFEPFSSASAFHSFPSGHAVNAVALALALILLAPRLKYVAVLWGVLIGLARVTLDRHFPGDVVAGWGVGIVVCAVVLWAYGMRPTTLLPFRAPAEAQVPNASASSAVAPATIISNASGTNLAQ